MSNKIDTTDTQAMGTAALAEGAELSRKISRLYAAYPTASDMEREIIIASIAALGVKLAGCFARLLTAGMADAAAAHMKATAIDTTAN